MTGPASFSVLIARVSTQDGDRILQTLESCANQTGEFDVEVVVGDRRSDALTDRIRADHPRVQVLSCGGNASIPEMLALLLREARGDYVVVTEDHCVPPSDWIASIAGAFSKAPTGTVAVGGCVENGVCDTALDWGTFFCEYSRFLTPVPEGPTEILPGMNIAYRRAALANLDHALFTDGFWETTVHPVLRKRSAVFYSTNEIKITHSKRFSLGFFCAQRFLYSRYYSGRRFGAGQRGHKVIAVLGSLLLPALILFRVFRNIATKQRLYREFARALPYLVVFAVVWMAGEIAGYLFGPGNALARIE